MAWCEGFNFGFNKLYIISMRKLIERFANWLINKQKTKKQNSVNILINLGKEILLINIFWYWPYAKHYILKLCWFKWKDFT